MKEVQEIILSFMLNQSELQCPLVSLAEKSHRNQLTLSKDQRSPCLQGEYKTALI